MASECSRADGAEQRRLWTLRRQPQMRLEPHRLVFIDETSINTKMARLRGCIPCGKRLRASAPLGHWGTQSFIAGLRCHGLTAPWIVDKAMDRVTFDLYIETQLAPTLSKGDIVILDNLAVHKSAQAARCLADRDAWFLFLRTTVPNSIPSKWPLPSSRRASCLGRNLRRAPGSRRKHLLALLGNRMPKLLQTRRICV